MYLNGNFPRDLGIFYHDMRNFVRNNHTSRYLVRRDNSNICDVTRLFSLVYRD